MPAFVTVAKVGDIPPNSGRAFPVGDQLVAVFNLGEGRYAAINDICPHQGASLAEGDLCEETVACPWHGWRFRVTDGCWRDNPRINTDVYPTRVEGDAIQVALPE